MVVGVGVDGSAGELQALMAVLGRSMAMCRQRASGATAATWQS